MLGLDWRREGGKEEALADATLSEGDCGEEGEDAG